MSAPIPGRSGPPPPPPNRAQELVARAGLSVYEPGRTLFDESVLVYVARPNTEWPDFDIFDHVGHPLGSVRQTAPRTWTSRAGFVKRLSVYDRGGNPVLNLAQSGHDVSTRFSLQGIVEGRMIKDIWRSQLSLEVSDRKVGLITGDWARGMSGMKLRIEDTGSATVAEIHGYREHSYYLSFIPSYVLSVEPALKGPLRYLLPAVPVALTIVRRIEQNG